MHASYLALREILSQFPACNIWFRPPFPQDRQWLDKPLVRALEARDFALKELGQARPYVKLVSAYNETGLNEQARAYWEFSMEYARLMRLEGLAVVSYNFSVEQPTYSEWSKYLPIPGDVLGLNQYQAPDLWSEPHRQERLTRHVQVRDLTGWTGPIIVGETGVDRGLLGEKLAGWRAPGHEIPISEYCKQIRWAANEFLQTGVTAAFLFNCGGAQWGWESFEVSNVPEISQTLASISHLGKDWPPQAVVLPRVGQGFQSVEHLVGPYLEDETYHFPGTDNEVSVAVGRRGFATWRRKTNETLAYVDEGQQIHANGGNSGNGQVGRVR